MQLRIKIKILLLPVKYFINLIKISIFYKSVLVISQKQHYFFFKGKRHLFKAVFTCVGLSAVLSAVTTGSHRQHLLVCFFTVLIILINNRVH